MTQYQFDPTRPPEFKPLESYGVIGDSRTAVLVGADGSIDWACMPDFDSPSVFGALLDPTAGRFVIRPSEPYTSRQRYERGTNVLLTEFETSDGTVRVRDFMPYTRRRVPTAEIYRRIEGVRGSVDMEIIFEPRFEYGLHEPQIQTTEYGVRAVDPKGNTIVLSTEIPMSAENGTARGRAVIDAGDETHLVADWGAAHVHPVTSYQPDRRLWHVRTFWRSWVDSLTYHGRYRDIIERSLLALKLLIYEPTGAIVAAPTTSLPEWPGGARNWDYRYSWVRDSAFILRAFSEARYTEEATSYFDWLLGQTLEGGPLQIMYGIRGERSLPERELPMRGYRDSRPVRIGNGAAHQFQLDIYGSLLALKLLIYEPTGAIVAAPTTSLPEWPGGARNWDYRYSWVRDSAFILRAFSEARYTEEATSYFDWLLGQTLEGGPLQIMYGIRGERSLPERELPMRGYRDSRPVRIGNGAAHQFQLDIYGSLLDAALRYDRQGGLLTIAEWEQLAELTEEVCRRWREPDAGIWEARNDPRHYTYSKVWAWVALTRAAELAVQLGSPRDTERWRNEAELIREEILEKAWNPDIGAFTQSYGADDLDAAVLVMPTVGFIPADDPRFQSTIEACIKGLGIDGGPLLYRYLNEDGVGGPEGAFLLPSFWIVESIALAGDIGRARALLSKLIKYMNPLGLYSEEVHPESGELLGNFPQGFSHLGLINAIFRIEESKRVSEGW